MILTHIENIASQTEICHMQKHYKSNKLVLGINFSNCETSNCKL